MPRNGYQYTTRDSKSKEKKKKVTSKKENEEENNKERKQEKNKEIKERKEETSTKKTIEANKKADNKKTTKINNEKTNERENKIKELAQKVNQFAKDEEEELEEIANTEVVPQEKIVKIEEIKKTIKNKKELPQEEIKKINKMLFKNIIIAIGIIIYFIFLNLGKINIENSVYTTDLKVFSMCTLLVAIIIIEISYKKENGELALHGIELILLAIATFSLIYINLMLSSRYLLISTAISFMFAIYYLIKSMVIYLKKRKQYFINNMKEIMNKDEVE